MNFRKDINGLRAIAVIAVVLFHFNPSWMPGGFAGVDVFFVISGFLMTGIIFRGIEQENFSILKFYVARANRIIPALAVLCTALLIFGWFYLSPPDYKVLGKHIASSMVFSSNIVYWSEAGYFDSSSLSKWLLHTWSLSAEWQFYILYPLVLVVMSKFLSLRLIKATVLFGAIVGFIFCVIATYKWPTSSYFLLPTRAWEMMIGGVAYFYPFTLKNEKKKLLELVGISLIIGSYLLISEDNPWPGYLAIFPVLGSFLIIQAQRNESFITGNIIFQKLGSWSYSIYLWHWPFVVAIYYFSLSHTFIYFGLLLSVLTGFISYRYIEKMKFRNDYSKLRDYLNCKPVYMVIVIGLSAYYINLTDGENVWLQNQDITTQKTYTILSTKNNPTSNDWHADENSMQDFSECRFNVQKLNTESKLRLKKCRAEFGPGVLILGDSHSRDLFGMVTSRFNDNFIVGVTNTQGCRPYTQLSHCPFKDVEQFISANNTVFKNVIYEQAGFYLFLDEHGNKGSRDMFSKLSLSEAVKGLTLDVERIDIVAAYLSEISKDVPVTWFGSRIEPHFTNKQILSKGCDYNFKLRTNQKKMYDLLDQYIKAKTASLDNIRFLSQNKTLNIQLSKDFMTCEKTLWTDGDHFSSQGELIFGQRLPSDFLSPSLK